MPTVPPHLATPVQRPPGPDELLHEAEAQCALAELFPHLKGEALRAIQDLFPLRAQPHFAPAARLPSLH